MKNTSSKRTPSTKKKASSKKKVSAKKKPSPKKPLKKKASPYIEVDGNVYELISSKSTTLTLDLAQDVLSKIDREVDRGVYLSRGDAIRHIIRTMIESETPIE